MTNLTNAEKVRIVRRHTEEDVPLIDLSDEYGISPDQIYTWKRQMAEAGFSRRLLNAKLVTRDQLRRGIMYQQAHGGRTVDALIELGFLKPEVLVGFMARQEGIPSLKLRHYNVDANVAKLVSRDFAAERLALPIDQLGRLLTVAMACPLDDDTVSDISKLTGLRAKPVLADRLDILWAIERLFSDGKAAQSSSEDATQIPATDASRNLRPVPTPDIVKMIKRVDMLPLVPGSIALLRQAMSTRGVQEESLLRIIMEDPLMTARLLTLANAEPFGLAGQVYSLRKAISILGLEKACTHACAADAVDLYSNWDRFNVQAYWTDALYCAKAASLLARHCQMGREDDFYTAGLLHDIGRIALCEILPVHYEQIGLDATGFELLVLENEILGMPHTAAGYELAMHWHLPGEFAEAIRSHHFPEQAQNSCEFAAIVCIGNVMADCARKSRGMDNEILENCRTAMSMVGLRGQDFRQVFDDFMRSLPSLVPDDATANALPAVFENP